jgi:hypothetical protein
MKKMISLLAVLALACQLNAQIYISPGSNVFIPAGKAVSFDSLTITPTANLTLSDIIIKKSHTPVEGSFGKSVARVYMVESPSAAPNPVLQLQGTVGMYVKDSDLNGNQKESLEITYYDGNEYVMANGSSVELASGYVSKLFGSSTNFSIITAASKTSVNTNQQLNKDLAFRLYPNPARGQFFLSLDEAISEAVVVRIHDISGKEIFRRQLDRIKSEPMLISIDDWASGMYIVVIETSPGALSQKLTVHQ